MMRGGEGAAAGAGLGGNLWMLAQTETMPS